MAVDRSDPIAIVGIGCRFPGGITDLDTFWRLLRTGTDAISDVPPDRWDLTSFYDADPGTPARMFVRQGGFLDTSIDTFDAGFFGIPPREAAALDPQQRLLLEVTWEAFENAGIPVSSTAATEVGVYVGGFTFDAATLQLAEANQHLVNSATPTGVSMTMLAARLIRLTGADPRSRSTQPAPPPWWHCTTLAQLWRGVTVRLPSPAE